MAQSGDDKTYLDGQSGLADTAITKDNYSPFVHSAGAMRGMLGSGRDSDVHDVGTTDEATNAKGVKSAPCLMGSLLT